MFLSIIGAAVAAVGYLGFSSYTEVRTYQASLNTFHNAVTQAAGDSVNNVITQPETNGFELVDSVGSADKTSGDKLNALQVLKLHSAAFAVAQKKPTGLLARFFVTTEFKKSESNFYSRYGALMSAKGELNEKIQEINDESLRKDAFNPDKKKEHEKERVARLLALNVKMDLPIVN